jgi:uncharacterized protein with GYD domain
MATYVVLLNWTEQGIKNFKDSTKRASAARDEMQKAGVTLRDIYWTIGAYDIVCLFEASDDESLAAALLKLGSGGNVRTTTMRAYSQTEFEGIVSRAG